MKISDILKELNVSMNDYQLQKELGIPQPTLYRLRKSKINSCSFDRGMKIVKFARSKGIVVPGFE